VPPIQPTSAGTVLPDSSPSFEYSPAMVRRSPLRVGAHLSLLIHGAYSESIVVHATTSQSGSPWWDRERDTRHRLDLGAPKLEV
jgi:hypothetical protein